MATDTINNTPTQLMQRLIQQNFYTRYHQRYFIVDAKKKRLK
jgi:hypothetical protein